MHVCVCSQASRSRATPSCDSSYSVMLRRSHLFLGITSTFGELMSLALGNNTPTRPRIEPGSPDPETDALTTRPVRPPFTLSNKEEMVG